MKLTIIAVFGTMLLFTACGGGNGEQENTTQQDAAQEEVQTTVVYYCPMECEGDKTYAEPGSCPVCGMDLVEKGGDAEHTHEGDGHSHEDADHMHE